MSPIEVKIMQESRLVASGENFNSRQISEELGLPPNTTTQALYRLATDGYLRQKNMLGQDNELAVYYRNRLQPLVIRRHWGRDLASELEAARA